MSASVVVVVALMVSTMLVHQMSLVVATSTTAVDTDGRPQETTTGNVVSDVISTTTTTTDHTLVLSRERNEVTGLPPGHVNGSESSSSAYGDVTVTSSAAENESSTVDPNKYFLSLWQFQRGLAILQYGLPVLLAFTTIDNILAVVVLQHPTFRGSSTGFILSALAAADMLVVYTGLLKLWVFSRFNFDFLTTSNNSCKFLLFFTSFSRQLSAWTLVLLTIERFVAVRFPFQCRRLCSLRRVVIAWCVIFVVLFGADSHIFATYAVIPNGEDLQDLGCRNYDEYDYFIRNQWYLINAFLSHLVPFVVIFAGNIAILLVIAIENRRRATLSQGQASWSNKVTSMTLTLIVISVVFIVLNVPSDVYLIGFQQTASWLDPAVVQARGFLFYAAVQLISYISNSINFLMYFVSGRKFRRAALDVIRCHCFRRRRCPKDDRSVPVRNAHSSDTSMSTILTTTTPRTIRDHINIVDSESIS